MADLAASILPVLDYLPVRAMDREDRPTLNTLIKEDLPAALGPIVGSVGPYYEVKGRTGRGFAQAHCPWVGIHDRRVPSKAQTGFYIALLLVVDGSGIVLSLQLGSGSRTREGLTEDVAAYRTHTPRPDGFTAERPIIVPQALRSEYDAALNPYAYELASVYQRTYTRPEVERPTFEVAFEADVLRLMHAYGAWATNHLSAA